jgi:hypothetical protein
MRGKMHGSMVVFGITRPNCSDSSLQITRKRKRLFGRQPSSTLLNVQRVRVSTTYHDYRFRLCRGMWRKAFPPYRLFQSY